MDTQIVQKISAQIYKKFPEVAGSHPKVQAQGSESSYLLIFKGSGTTADGKRIERTVRVVASDRGKIIKVTTSR
jgi:hypothetical protein